MTLLTLIGCNEHLEKSVSQNDRLKLVPESDKDLREKYEQSTDTLTTDTTYQEFRWEKLKPIREKLKPLAGRQEWTGINKRKIDPQTGYGVAVYYFLHDQLRKIRVLQKADSTDRFAEFYLEDNNLFFVFERHTDSSELKNDPEYYQPLEDSLFFENSNLIMIKSNKGCGAPFAEDYKKEEQVRLKSEFEKLRERLKK